MAGAELANRLRYRYDRAVTSAFDAGVVPKLPRCDRLQVYSWVVEATAGGAGRFVIDELYNEISKWAEETVIDRIVEVLDAAVFSASEALVFLNRSFTTILQLSAFVARDMGLQLLDQCRPKSNQAVARVHLLHFARLVAMPFSSSVIVPGLVAALHQYRCGSTDDSVLKNAMQCVRVVLATESILNESLYSIGAPTLRSVVELLVGTVSSALDDDASHVHGHIANNDVIAAACLIDAASGREQRIVACLEQELDECATTSSCMEFGASFAECWTKEQISERVVETQEKCRAAGRAGRETVCSFLRTKLMTSTIVGSLSTQLSTVMRAIRDMRISTSDGDRDPETEHRLAQEVRALATPLATLNTVESMSALTQVFVSGVLKDIQQCFVTFVAATAVVPDDCGVGVTAKHLNRLLMGAVSTLFLDLQAVNATWSRWIATVPLAGVPCATAVASEAVRMAFEQGLSRKVDCWKGAPGGRATEFRVAELAALHCDVVMRESGDDDAAVSLTADVASVLAFVPDRDVLGEVYRERLADRLLSSSDATHDAEVELLEVLRFVLPPRTRHQCVRMIRDAVVSRTCSLGGLFSCRLLTAAVWPIRVDPVLPVFSAAIPRSMSSLPRLAEGFSREGFGHVRGSDPSASATKKLTWLHNLARAVVVLWFPSAGPKEVVCSAYHAVILEVVASLLNGNVNATFTLSQVVDAFGVREHAAATNLLRLHLDCLAAFKSIVARASATKGAITADEPLLLNSTLSVGPRRFVLPPPTSLYSSSFSQAQLDSSRSMLIDSAVIRVMKSSRRIPASELTKRVAEIVERGAMWGKGSVATRVIKERIMDLMQREFVRRSQPAEGEHEDFFEYVA